MQATFNDLEALRIAIDIERQGERFYRIAAKKIDDQEATHMLNQLSEEERDHAETFKAIYDTAFATRDQFDDTYLFDPEVAAYLTSMVKSIIFPDTHAQDVEIGKITGIEDVFKMAIQAEKDSILFYTEMIIYSKFVDAKNAFRKLLGQEKKHLLDLQTRLEAFAKI